MDKEQIPRSDDFLWPTLKALKDRGGSASIQELSGQVATDMALPDELLDVRSRLSCCMGANQSEVCRCHRQYVAWHLDDHRSGAKNSDGAGNP